MLVQKTCFNYLRYIGLHCYLADGNVCSGCDPASYGGVGKDEVAWAPASVEAAIAQEFAEGCYWRGRGCNWRRRRGEGRHSKRRAKNRQERDGQTRGGEGVDAEVVMTETPVTLWYPMTSAGTDVNTKSLGCGALTVIAVLFMVMTMFIGLTCSALRAVLGTCAAVTFAVPFLGGITYADPYGADGDAEELDFVPRIHGRSALDLLRTVVLASVVLAHDIAFCVMKMVGVCIEYFKISRRNLSRNDRRNLDGILLACMFITCLYAFACVVTINVPVTVVNDPCLHSPYRDSRGGTCNGFATNQRVLIRYTQRHRHGRRRKNSVLDFGAGATYDTSFLIKAQLVREGIEPHPGPVTPSGTPQFSGTATMRCPGTQSPRITPLQSPQVQSPGNHMLSQQTRSTFDMRTQQTKTRSRLGSCCTTTVASFHFGDEHENVAPNPAPHNPPLPPDNRRQRDPTVDSPSFASPGLERRRRVGRPKTAAEGSLATRAWYLNRRDFLQNTSPMARQQATPASFRHSPLGTPNSVHMSPVAPSPVAFGMMSGGPSPCLSPAMLQPRMGNVATPYSPDMLQGTGRFVTPIGMWHTNGVPYPAYSPGALPTPTFGPIVPSLSPAMLPGMAYVPMGMGPVPSPSPAMLPGMAYVHMGMGPVPSPSPAMLPGMAYVPNPSPAMLPGMAYVPSPSPAMLPRMVDDGDSDTDDGDSGGNDSDTDSGVDDYGDIGEVASTDHVALGLRAHDLALFDSDDDDDFAVDPRLLPHQVMPHLRARMLPMDEDDDDDFPMDLLEPPSDGESLGSQDSSDSDDDEES